MIANSAELELGLVWDHHQQSFDVSLRFTDTSNVDWQKHPKEPLPIDEGQLASLVNDEPAYGEALTAMIFQQTEVGQFYRMALTAAKTTPVHFRIHLDGPRRFHALRWESLRDPTTGSPIATSRNILLSRYLTSLDWRPIPPHLPREPRALVVIAAPTGRTGPG